MSFRLPLTGTPAREACGDMRDLADIKTIELNGRKYEISADRDGFYRITREDGKALGCAAAYHGAVYACTLDAFPRQYRSE